MAASHTGGVKAFSLQGRLFRERERLYNMTNEERAWRNQWLKDQILSPSEPREVPELQKALKNPIRRFYQFPLNMCQKILKPMIGATAAMWIRVFAGKTLMGLALLYAGAYYFKYNANDWTRKGGWRVVPNRPAVFPGDPDYPKTSDRICPCQYGSRGFNDSPI